MFLCTRIKKKEQNVVNYRGISLLSMVGKIFVEVDQIFILKQIGEKAQEKFSLPGFYEGI